jgi:hypothetical protein
MASTDQRAQEPKKRGWFQFHLSKAVVITIVAGAIMYPIVRIATRKPGAVQVTEELADAVLRKPELASLQQWSAQVLERYSSGQLATSGRSTWWGGDAVVLSAQEIPDGILRAWNDSHEPPPEISIRVSPAGRPECVAISWQLCGIVVGPSDYQITFKPWCSKQAKPGVYAYYLYR